MKQRKLTIAESTRAARQIIQRSTREVDVHGWLTELTLRGIGLGFHIPAHAYADAADLRTQGNLAKWLRLNAI